jgi:hypothetical protein
MVKLRKLRWVGHVARVEWKRNVYMVVVGRAEGKKPLGRPLGRWKGTIKIIHKDGMGGCGLD